MTNNSPLLSFIVPVFNAEPYIEDCLDSIIRQKLFCDCEVICVDDKSTDRSCEIIAEYEKRYLNVHLIKHDVNKKAGGARNTGINVATGQYLWFVDSDDWIAPNCLKDMITECEKNDLDVLVFSHSVYSCGKLNISHNFNNSSSIVSGIDLLNRYVNDNFDQFCPIWRYA